MNWFYIFLFKNRSNSIVKNRSIWTRIWNLSILFLIGRKIHFLFIAYGISGLFCPYAFGKKQFQTYLLISLTLYCLQHIREYQTIFFSIRGWSVKFQPSAYITRSNYYDNYVKAKLKLFRTIQVWDSACEESWFQTKKS